MDPMEIMIEIMGFRRLRVKTKQARILYSSPLGYSDSRKTSSRKLISQTDLADSRLTILHSRSSQLLTLPSILLKQLSCA